MGFFILMQYGHNCDETSKLLREVILPRLDALEGELHELRAVTWPVCQGLWDRKMPFMNISMKKRFFTFLDESIFLRLIKSKATYCSIDDVTMNQEIEMLREIKVCN
jgi:hypothetical protein